jgi:hypothetical protein
MTERYKAGSRIGRTFVPGSPLLKHRRRSGVHRLGQEVQALRPKALREAADRCHELPPRGLLRPRSASAKPSSSTTIIDLGKGGHDPNPWPEVA